MPPLFSQMILWRIDWSLAARDCLDVISHPKREVTVSAHLVGALKSLEATVFNNCLIIFIMLYSICGQRYMDDGCITIPKRVRLHHGEDAVNADDLIVFF